MVFSCPACYPISWSCHSPAAWAPKSGVASTHWGRWGGGLDVVAVRGEAELAPQAHRTAPYRPCCSLDQWTTGQYQWQAQYPCRGVYMLRAYWGKIRAPLPAWRRAGGGAIGTKKEFVARRTTRSTFYPFYFWFILV